MGFYRRKKRTRVAKKASDKSEKCITKRCLNARAINNTGRPLRHCWKCRSRLLKARHPETYTLNAIRQRAKARGIKCDITLEDWKDFCRKTGYLQNRGQKSDSATVDRIDDRYGYHIWNIRIMPHGENSRDQYRCYNYGETREGDPF